MIIEDLYPFIWAGIFIAGGLVAFKIYAGMQKLKVQQQKKAEARKFGVAAYADYVEQCTPQAVAMAEAKLAEVKARNPDANFAKEESELQMMKAVSYLHHPLIAPMRKQIVTKGMALVTRFLK